MHVSLGVFELCPTAPGFISGAVRELDALFAPFRVRFVDIVNFENDTAEAAGFLRRPGSGVLGEREGGLAAFGGDGDPAHTGSHRGIHGLFPTELVSEEPNRLINIVDRK